MADHLNGIDVDPDRLAELAGLGEEPGWFAMLLRQYIEDTRSRLVAIGGALAGGDARGVAEAAHALKGSSANLGTRGVATIASRMQGMGRDGNLKGGMELLNELQNVAGLTITHLEQTYLSGERIE